MWIRHTLPQTQLSAVDGCSLWLQGYDQLFGIIHTHQASLQCNAWEMAPRAVSEPLRLSKQQLLLFIYLLAHFLNVSGMGNSSMIFIEDSQSS